MLVHKDHCKKLARAKELQEEGKDLSKVQVSISSHHPFPAKGLLKDTTETFVVLILRILSEMRLTPKSAYDLPYFHEKLTKLERAMDENRRMIWTNRKIRPEQFRIAAVDTCRDQYFRTKEAVVMVKNKASEDLWPTLHLVWGRLMEHMVTLQIDMLKDPRSAVPLEVWDGLEDGIGPFPDRLKELVTALCSTKFPSFKNLLSIYCGGSLVQDCSFCSIPVTVAAVEGEVLGWQGGMVKGVATALHLPYMPPMYCCGSASCKEKMLEKHSVWTDWAVAVWTVINKLGFSVCHNCFKLAEEIHRCSKCLTKTYCSEECRLLGWETTHKQFCKELKAEKRKKKNTAQERKVAESEGLELAFKEGVTLDEEALKMKKLCQKGGRPSKVAKTASSVAKAEDKKGGVMMGESKSAGVGMESRGPQPPAYISEVD